MYVSIQTQQGHFYDTFIIFDDCNKSRTIKPMTDRKEGGSETSGAHESFVKLMLGKKVNDRNANM